MDSYELVHKLIRGSEEIDRMKKEVESVVRMVIGFVEPWWTTFRMQSGDEYKFPGGRWVIRKMLNDKISVECWVRHPASNELAFSTVPGGIPFRLDNVQDVHTALPFFLDGIARSAPQVKAWWQPLLDAAEAAK